MHRVTSSILSDDATDTQIPTPVPIGPHLASKLAWRFIRESRGTLTVWVEKR